MSDCYSLPNSSVQLEDLAEQEEAVCTLSRSKSRLSLDKVEPTATPSIVASHGEWWCDGGVSKVAFITYMICAFWTVGSFPFVATSLIYLLQQKFHSSYTNDHFRSSLALFVVFDQVISILTSPLWGFLSEKIGRRRCYSGGLIVISAAIGVFPLSKVIFPERFVQFFYSLVFFRIIYGIGAACCSVMFSTVMTDYCENNRKSQGKLAAMAGLSAGLGAVTCVTGLAHIGAKQHSYIMCYITSGCIGTSAIMCFFFMRDAPRKLNKSASLSRNLLLGITRLSQPSIAIACMSGFLCRGNNLIPLMFITQRSRTNSFAVMSLLGMCLFGYGARRVNPLRLLMISSLMTIFGFIGMQEIKDSVIGCIAGCLAGIGQGGLTVSGMALLSGSVEMEERSAISSTFNLLGNLGILTVALLGYVCTEENRKFTSGIYISSFINVMYFLIVFWVTAVIASKRALSSDKYSI